jgi:hypothetical protein
MSSEEKGSGGGLAKALKALDFHPKLVKDFAVRTKSGAAGECALVGLARFAVCATLSYAIVRYLCTIAVSLTAITIATLLFIAELRYFWTVVSG